MSRQVHGRRSQGNGLMTSPIPRWVHCCCKPFQEHIRAPANSIVLLVLWHRQSLNTHPVSAPKCPRKWLPRCQRSKMNNNPSEHLCLERSCWSKAQPGFKTLLYKVRRNRFPFRWIGGTYRTQTVLRLVLITDVWNDWVAFNFTVH